MPTLVATAGNASANSYITVAEADTYFDERLNVSSWTSAGTDDKERALIAATRRIDQEQYEGEKVASGQSLKWPRYFATDEDGNEYATDAIPTLVEHATCELALKLLNDGAVDPLMDTGLEEFKSANVGPMAIERDLSFRAGQLPANVKRILRPVITTANNSVRMERA